MSKVEELRLKAEEDRLELDKLESILALMKKYKVSSYKKDGLEVEKLIHDDDTAAATQPKSSNDDEELLYWSTGE